MKAKEEFKTAQTRLLQRVGVQAESRFLDVAAVSGQVHVLVSGEGPPVVMIPGFGDPAAMWAPLMAKMAKMAKLDGFTLYAVDRPCFGLTGSALHTTATIRTLAVDFLEQVLDGLNLEQPSFVANSMGSLWVIWLAMDRPNRVAAMSHIGCPAFLLGTSAPLPMRLLAIPPIGRVLMRLFPPSPKQVDQFAAMAGADLSSLPELRDLLVATQKLPGVPAAMRELLHAVMSFRGARPEIELTAAQLSQLSQSVQFLWGEHDPFGGPEVGERAASIVPNAEFHLIPNAGHVPWINHPDPVSEYAKPFLRGA